MLPLFTSSPRIYQWKTNAAGTVYFFIVLFASLFFASHAFAASQGEACASSSDCDSGLTCQDVDPAPETETRQCQARVQTGFGLGAVEQGIDLSALDFRVIILRIINAALGLLGIILVCIILYAGYLIMLSGGEEQKILAGRRMLLNAVIGLAIILSAFIIVRFVMNALLRATGLGIEETGDGRLRRPLTASFAGSGSLGRVVQDHYPFRDDVNVSRNTKIVVTFVEGVHAPSLIEDTNANGILGDCVKPDGVALNYQEHCDHLNAAVVQIVSADAPNDRIGAAVIASQNAQGEYRTFSFKPFSLLGSDREPVVTTVTLTNGILKQKINADDDDVGVFTGQRVDFYPWSFTLGTGVDEIPPSVSFVSPAKTADRNARVIIPRNKVIRIQFSEPVDPTVAAGVSGTSSPFSHLLLANTRTDVSTVAGEWRISNGYKTVEFIPSEACGTNSCGDVMYCLPIDCGDPSCTDEYTALIQTAKLDGSGSWQANPFTGVMDMSGNALNGGDMNVK
ncbi:MAG: hypothetical protein AAB932_04210, partial [Patescibacteria group bacterium]